MEIKQIKGILGHECMHTGQHGAYTDSTYEYNITTEDGKEIPENELLSYCFSLVGREKIQSCKLLDSHIAAPCILLRDLHSGDKLSFMNHVFKLSRELLQILFNS